MKHEGEARKHPGAKHPPATTRPKGAREEAARALPAQRREFEGRALIEIEMRRSCMYCTECGSTLLTDSRFCPNCRTEKSDPVPGGRLTSVRPTAEYTSPLSQRTTPPPTGTYTPPATSPYAPRPVQPGQPGPLAGGPRPQQTPPPNPYAQPGTYNQGHRPPPGGPHRPGAYTPPGPYHHPPGPYPGGYVTPPPKRSSRPVVIVLCTVAGLFALLVIIAMVLDYLEDNQQAAVYVPTQEEAHHGHVIGHEPENQVTVAPTDSDTLPAAEIFANNRDAVVIIRGTCVDGHSWTGSGFFLTSTGIAVTNHHVMDGLTTAFAILYDGREFLVTGYYSYDIGNDLAIIQVDGRGTSFDYVTLGNSDETRVGENVFAIGGPDWDPLTFTPGMISRIAYEPINFNIYSIAGMLQSTAAIYGGNSGGPLLNDRGHVIGVNAAAHTIRASVQFAIPINRVLFPAPGTAERQLPIGRRGITPAPESDRGDVFMYTRFSFIPDFMSVSRHGSFAFSGTPANLGLYPGDIIYDFYGYLFAYDMPPQHWVSDTDIYDIELITAGFVFQEVVTFEGETWVYFYHPGHSMSLSYAFLSEINTLLIAIVEGDVHARFYGQGDPSPITPPDGVIVNHGDHPLIGTWEWDSDAAYIYIFREDGTGTRGFSGDRYDFYWLAHNGVLYMDVGRLMTEEWSYVISNYVLTIDSNQQAGFRWSYIRQ